MAPSFSILFPISSTTDSTAADEPDFSSSTTNSSSVTCSSPTSSTSSVDCTLSLGTPSTRVQTNHTISSPNSTPAMYYWDVFSEPKDYKHYHETVTATNCNNNAALKGYSYSVGNGGGGNNGNLGGDPLLLARRCANCDTTSTPLWRNGPRGPKSLCNACGIRYKKEERRAASSTTSAVPVEQGTACGYQQAQPWSFNYGSAKTGMYGHDSSENNDHMAASYLPWRFGAVPVQERTTLYQYN